MYIHDYVIFIIRSIYTDRTPTKKLSNECDENYINWILHIIWPRKEMYKALHNVLCCGNM